MPSLVVIPFGTALAVYTFWTLLNDDARHAFGELTGQRAKVEGKVEGTRSERSRLGCPFPFNLDLSFSFCPLPSALCPSYAG